jgi:hypothetical protein
MTSRLEHHNKILTVLESLNSDILRKGSAYFGGGTLLAFEFEEYRWSKDIDFIASQTPRLFREQHDIFADLEIQKETREDS